MNQYTLCRKKFLNLLVLAIIFFSIIFRAHGQQVEVIKADQLFDMVENCPDQNKILLYNFWATWCAPCIRELPVLESVNASFSNVDVILISIDDVDLLNSKVIPFVDKKKIASKVVLLDETDFNDIINRIDDSWSGAIPASLIVDCRTKKRSFYEKEFDEEELKKVIIEIKKNHP